MGELLLQLFGVLGGGGLDAHDFATREVLRGPFEQIRTLLQAHDLEQVAARDEWKALLAVASETQRGSNMSLDFDPPPRFPKLPVLPHSEKARTLGNYEPNTRVKILQTVVHDPAGAKVLQCSLCSYR